MNEQLEVLRLAEDWQKRAEYLQIWIDDGVGAEFSYRHEGLISEQKIQFDTAAKLRHLHLVNQELVEALERLAKLGNGDHYGNSVGNEIARAAIAKAKRESNE